MTALTLSSLTVGAAGLKPTRTVVLYPEGQDPAKSKGISEDGVYVTNGPGESNGVSGGMHVDAKGHISNIGDDACIDLYLPKKCNGQMVIVCPGGGYSFVSSIGEGENVADWLYRRNIAVGVLKYRLPNHHANVPLTDVQNAFRYCRAHAGEWGVFKLGVMGFSAGGHLAASAATLYTDAVTKPDFAVLVYPVISMDEKISHKGSREQLTGGDSTMVRKFSIEKWVDHNTPQTLLLLSADDRTVNPENSIRYFNAMLASKVKVEMHVFATGGHGYGFVKQQFLGKGKDSLGKQRKDFDDILERFLSDYR